MPGLYGYWFIIEDMQRLQRHLSVEILNNELIIFALIATNKQDHTHDPTERKY